MRKQKRKLYEKNLQMIQNPTNAYMLDKLTGVMFKIDAVEFRKELKWLTSKSIIDDYAASSDKDNCGKCGKPWDDHEFAVPAPYCP